MSVTPELRHIYQNHHLDTRHWDNFQPRSGDIVISTSYKAGTTLTQTIVTNLLFPNDDMPGSVSSISPWLDMRLSPLDETLATLEAQTHR
ncbi:MAG: sulfotransferase domain-containing protein, partial [Gammaproteobacteria bacterium]|nr:sulfotransferase domain-containing protein [Gammaproteobacteria bacterium]